VALLRARRYLPGVIHLPGGAAIPESELTFSVSRSGGPGGQHVNKVATRVSVELDVEASRSLSEAQKQRIRTYLASRLTRLGRLRLSCGVHRSQAANRREVVERLRRMLEQALRPRRKRVATGVPHAERDRRREQKRRRSAVKGARRVPAGDE
jgi:ribosome-associated protein